MAIIEDFKEGEEVEMNNEDSQVNASDSDVPIEVPPISKVTEDCLLHIMCCMQDSELKNCWRVAKLWKGTISDIMTSSRLLESHLQICTPCAFYIYAMRTSSIKFEFYEYVDDRPGRLPESPSELTVYSVLDFCETKVLVGTQSGTELLVYDLYTREVERLPEGTAGKSISMLLSTYADTFELFVIRVYEVDNCMRYQVLDMNAKKWREGSPLLVPIRFCNGVAIHERVYYRCWGDEKYILLKVDVRLNSQKMFPIPSEYNCQRLDIIGRFITIFELANTIRFNLFDVKAEKWLEDYYFFDLKQLGWKAKPYYTSIMCSSDGFFLFQKMGLIMMKVNLSTQQTAIHKMGFNQQFGGGRARKPCVLVQNKGHELQKIVERRKLDVVSFNGTNNSVQNLGLASDGEDKQLGSSVSVDERDGVGGNFEGSNKGPGQSLPLEKVLSTKGGVIADHRLKLNKLVREVKYSKRGVLVKTEDSYIYKAKFAMQWKILGINAFDVTIFTKVFLKFPSKFWPTGPGTTWFLYAHQRRGYYPVWQHFEDTYPGSNILMVLITDEESRRVEQQSDAATEAEAMEVLRKKFGNQIPNPTDIIVSRWWHDRFFKGTFGNWPIGYSRDSYEQMKAPIGPVFFTREHTSKKYNGYLHGAYLSGIDSANHLIKCIKNGDCGAKKSKQRVSVSPSFSCNLCFGLR